MKPLYLQLAKERYAWPGGYEVFFVCDDGGVLCSPCVVKEWDEVINDSEEGDGWFLIGFDHTGATDERTQCDHCYRVIQEDQ